jgi:hypothetical protein
VSRAVAAELLKFRTTCSIGFVLAAVALVGIAAAGTVGTAEDDLGTMHLSREILRAHSSPRSSPS